MNTTIKSLITSTLLALLTACNQSTPPTQTQPADTQSTANAPTPAPDTNMHAHHNTTAPMAAHSVEYMQSMQKMHDDMTKAVQKANADVAFALGMIPHHQGAIEMANIQLKYGKDEQMRKLAQDIIAAQDPEITLMQNWLKTQGVASE